MKAVRMVTSLAAAAVAVLAWTSPASASSFPAQARAAGLTASQAAGLQAKVDRYLAEVGGTQVAPNHISLNGGDLWVTVPGEARVRDLAGTGSVTPLLTCYSGDFCGYKGYNYTGDAFSKYKCNSAVNIPSAWRSARTGSYRNNQSSGTVAYFYNNTNGTGSVVLHSTAVENQAAYDWGFNTRSIIACK